MHDFGQIMQHWKRLDRVYSVVWLLVLVLPIQQLPKRDFAFYLLHISILSLADNENNVGREELEWAP